MLQSKLVTLGAVVVGIGVLAGIWKFAPGNETALALTGTLGIAIVSALRGLLDPGASK